MCVCDHEEAALARRPYSSTGNSSIVSRTLRVSLGFLGTYNCYFQLSKQTMS